jgi:hypothetical protein
MSSTSTATVSDVGMEAAIDYIAEIRERILFTLAIYPKLSPTMLQVSLGTSTRPSIWHPVLNQLIEEGLVDRVQIRPPTPAPSGRDQVFTVIQLKG